MAYPTTQGQANGVSAADSMLFFADELLSLLHGSTCGRDGLRADRRAATHRETVDAGFIAMRFRLAWLRLPRFALLLLAAINVSAADVDGAAELLSECRHLRLAEPADALPRCEAAAAAMLALDDHEAGFEAWMHAAEVASQLGDRARAEAALDQAVPLLVRVRDPLAAHRLARRRGLNAYRDGRPVDALSRFLEALAAARASDDTQAIAISENDLGVIHRHLGNHAVALGHLQSSLQLRSVHAESGHGALLANIGSLYLELGDLAAARRDLERALDDHRDNGREMQAQQTIEELARLDEREGRPADAQARLRDALDYYRDVRAPRDQLRVALRLASLEAEQGARKPAQAWLEEARRLARELDRHGLLQVELIAARLADSDAARRHTYAALAAALADAGESATARSADAHAALADLAEALGQPQQGLVHLRESHRLATALQDSRHGERLDALRVRFDVARLEAERDRLFAESARQEALVAVRRFETLLVAVAALLALAALAMMSQARLYRQRRHADLQRVALELRIGDARQAATLLRSDLRSTEWLLEQQHRAALVFDAAGTVRAITASAALELGRPLAELQHRKLGEVMDPEVAEWAQSLVDSASLAEGAAGVDLGERLIGGDGMRVRCRKLDLEEELGVLLIGRDAPAAGDTAVAEAAGNDAPSARVEEDSRSAFRSRLVDLMQASTDAWERATRKSRVELAEASGIWRITIDDGRLRVRALDRYLRADTLPERPRWREVLRTAYFVLAEVPLEAEQRQRIESLVEELLHLARDRE